MGAALVALSPDDARDALVAVRLLDDVQLDLELCADTRAQLGLDLQRCRAAAAAAGPADPGASAGTGNWTPPPGGLAWREAAVWLLSGLAAGLVAGVSVTLALGG